MSERLAPGSEIAEGRAGGVTLYGRPTGLPEPSCKCEGLKNEPGHTRPKSSASIGAQRPFLPVPVSEMEREYQTELSTRLRSYKSPIKLRQY